MEKKMINKMYKIQEWLWENFFLEFYEDYNVWELHDRNADYEVVMSNETHNVQELYDFAKKNRTYDLRKEVPLLSSFFGFIGVILFFVGLSINNDYLRGFGFGVEIFFLIFQYVVSRIVKRNIEVKRKLLWDKMEKDWQEFIEKDIKKDVK